MHQLKKQVRTSVTKRNDVRTMRNVPVMMVSRKQDESYETTMSRVTKVFSTA